MPGLGDAGGCDAGPEWLQCSGRDLCSHRRSSTSPRHARRQSWEVLEEERQVSESHSVDAASRLLMDRGCSAVLRLPGDIPLVKTRDVDSLLHRAISNPGALMVPSRDGSGTNALLRSPPDVFPSCFGQGSFALHRAAAKRAGVSLEVIENARLGFDLDTPNDLVDFWRIGQGTCTWQVLDEFGYEGLENRKCESAH